MLITIKVYSIEYNKVKVGFLPPCLLFLLGYNVPCMWCDKNRVFCRPYHSRIHSARFPIGYIDLKPFGCDCNVRQFHLTLINAKCLAFLG